MPDTAIQKDVEEIEVVVGNQERNNMVAEIAARAKEERDKELKEAGHEIIDTSGKEPEQKQEEIPVEEIKPEPEPEEIQEPEEKEPETIKIKVDGQEKEVPKDKILDAGIRAMQKESAADKRLEEATRLLKEAEARYAQTQKQESPSQEWDDNTIAYALEHGTEEQKAYAVSQLRGREIATPDEIVKIAESRVLDKLDLMESNKFFETEYKDIVSDPYLLQIAIVEDNKLLAEGDTRSRKERYKEIGDNIRKWRGGTIATTTLETKKEQKSNIVNLQAASVKSAAPEQQKPKTTSDIIEEMRRKRGQA